MARFDIVRTQRTVSGRAPGAYANIDYDRGEGLEAQALQDMGSGLFALGEQFYIGQGQHELAEANAEDEKDINDLLLDLDQTKDPELYGKKFEQTWSKIAGREIKNGWARKKRALVLPGLEENIRKTVQIQQRERVVKNWGASLATMLAKAEQSGRSGPYAAYLSAGVQNGFLSQEEAKVLLAEGKRSIAIHRAERLAMQDPDAVLEDLRDHQLEGATELDARELRYIRNMAITFQRDQAIQRAQEQRRLTQGWWDVATRKGATAKDMQDYIDRLPDAYFHGDDKADLYKSMRNIVELVNDKGVHPFRVRQDYDKYWELVQAAEAGDGTEVDFRKAVNAGQITIQDYEHLNNIVEEEAGALSEAYSTTQVFRSLNKLIDESWDFLSGEKQAAKIKGRRILEDRILEARKEGNPIKGRNLENEMLRVFEDLKPIMVEAGTQTKDLFDLTEPEPKYIPWIWTQEQFDNLPKGSKFKDPEGNIRVKK